jgi:predicted metal-dependent phosphotriesterase family hydrolase
MRAHGFTDSELEMMFKENPAKAVGLSTNTMPSVR